MDGVAIHESANVIGDVEVARYNNLRCRDSRRRGEQQYSGRREESHG
jgi:carbonic anhydrase/acetyltransferase-like protein (isoleucine patch superfamily)